MVGAAPVCPPERPHSGVSIRKGNVPSRKGAVSIHKRCMLTPKHVCAFADGCALAGRRGRAHRHRPSTSIKPLYHVIFLDFVMLRTILRQSYNTNHTRNGRGGACVPARTSAQRRFHPQRARPHLQRSRFHPQMARPYPQKRRFQLPSPPDIIGRRGVYILRHLIIYVNHARAHCPSCGIMRQRYVFHGVMLFSRAIACVS